MKEREKLEKKEGWNAGAIAGIVIGGFLVVLIIVGVLFMVLSKGFDEDNVMGEYGYPQRRTPNPDYVRETNPIPIPTGPNRPDDWSGGYVHT